MLGSWTQRVIVIIIRFRFYPLFHTLLANCVKVDRAVVFKWHQSLSLFSFTYYFFLKVAVLCYIWESFKQLQEQLNEILPSYYRFVIQSSYAILINTFSLYFLSYNCRRTLCFLSTKVLVTLITDVLFFFYWLEKNISHTISKTNINWNLIIYKIICIGILVYQYKFIVLGSRDKKNQLFLVEIDHLDFGVENLKHILYNWI
jgi:hypothetical protein